MSIFKLEIQLGNAAMQTNEDLARALNQASHDIGGTTWNAGAIFDENGNRVGSMWLEEDDK